MDKFLIGKGSSAPPVSSGPANAAKENIKVAAPAERVTSINGDGTWEAGKPVPYFALVNTFEAISAVGGRLEKEELLSKLFREVIKTTPQDLEAIVYLAANAIAPAYEGLKLGIGDSLLVKAICEATGRNRDQVELAYKNEGDLGIVAMNSRANQKTLSFAAKPKPMAATYVLEQLRFITSTKGEKAQGRKTDIIKAMMVRCQSVEAKYLIRSLQGKLRIGTAQSTVLVSLAKAFVSCPSKASEEAKESEAETEDSDEPPEANKLRTQTNLSHEAKNELAVVAVKRSFSECPSLSILVTALLTKPLHELHRTCHLVAGVPVEPMLAKPTKGVDEVLKRLSGLEFIMEYKYDGERAQVHLLEDGTLKIFSRNSEDNSEKFPDLMENIRQSKHESVTSFVLDAEVVAYDRERKVILPFQVLSTRKRKVETGDEDNQKVKVVLQAFDLIFLNGKSLLRETLKRRKELLHQSFNEQEGFFYFASGMVHQENGDTAPIEAFMQEACAANSEGLMVKTLTSNATYEPSRRTFNWLKLKKDYIDGMGVCDSVDLVVIGGYHGRGKRTSFYGAFLMACYDPETDEFQSVCKVGTGFKDEDLSKFTELLTPLVIQSCKKPLNYNVGDPLEPDDWFESSTVWELQAADLSKSSVHKGGIGKIESGKGIGLRFPRFIRVRDDKKPEGATTAEQIVEMYNSQAEVGAVNDGDDDDEELL